jgi:hypothetical protein
MNGFSISQADCRLLIAALERYLWNHLPPAGPDNLQGPPSTTPPSSPKLLPKELGFVSPGGIQPKNLCGEFHPHNSSSPQQEAGAYHEACAACPPLEPKEEPADQSGDTCIDGEAISPRVTSEPTASTASYTTNETNIDEKATSPRATSEPTTSTALSAATTGHRVSWLNAKPFSSSPTPSLSLLAQTLPCRLQSFPDPRYLRINACRLTWDPGIRVHDISDVLT